MNDRIEERRQERTAAARRRLEGIRAEAVQTGTRLNKTSDRLRAACVLTRMWQKAKKAGISKSDFEGEIFSELRRARKGREEFRLSRFILKRAVMAQIEAAEGDILRSLCDALRHEHEPQKALEPYLVAAGVAARLCGEDAEDWQIELLSGLSLWQRHDGASEDGTDIPAENLALMVNALCRSLGQKNDLFGLIRRMEALPSRRNPFDDTFVPNSSNEIWANSFKFLDRNDGIYAGEVFPFPSLSLVHIREGSERYKVRLVPEGQDPGTVPLEIVDVAVYADIRLLVGPVGSSECGAMFETRGAYTLKRSGPNESEYPIRHLLELHDVSGDELRGQPHLHVEMDGERRDLVDREGPLGEEPLFLDQFNRFPLGEGPDISDGGHLWSHTTVTPGYLRHWLGGGHGKPGSRAAAFEHDGPLESSLAMAKALPELLPRPDRLNFWEQGPLRWLEEALHDGRAEKVLQAAFDRLIANVEAREKYWRDAREESTQALLNRWRPVSKDKLE